MIDTRKVLTLLTKQMTDVPAEDFRGWSAKDLSLYTRAREAFISGGARAVETLEGFEQSLQVAIALGTPSRFLSGPLVDKLTAWLAEKRFDKFFFVRKPPGMRLRFFGRYSQGLQRVLFKFLDGERKRGAIDGYALSVYEGETYQFGGEEGLALMHEHGTYDSLWALNICRRQDSTSDPAILSLLALNDLFRKVVGDNFEGWDVWENMRLTGRVLEDAAAIQHLREDARAQRVILRATWHSRDDLLRKLNRGDGPLMRDYFSRNDSWVRKYRRVAESGSLLYGIRKILPFYAIFHWNRLGFSSDQQCALTHYMRHTLDPKENDEPVRQEALERANKNRKMSRTKNKKS